MARLAGRTAIITGGTSGIGRGIARRFVREGAEVVVVARGEAAGRETENELRALGGDACAVFLSADLSDRSALEAVVGRVAERNGRIDILINNGQGIPPLRSLINKPDRDFELALVTGLHATRWLMNAVFPLMRASGGGAIVNMCSVSGLIAPANTGDYNAAKEAIRSITRSAANEWGRYGIRVNAINPAAELAGLRNWADANPALYRTAKKLIPMKRYGDPERDVGNLVLGLCGDAGRFITGQSFCADGGMAMVRRKRPGTDVEGVDYQQKEKEEL